MESFFLSETAKYLYMLGANATGLPDFYVLTTEGHLLPPLRAAAAASAGVGSGKFSLISTVRTGFFQLNLICHLPAEALRFAPPICRLTAQAGQQQQLCW